MGNFTWLGLGVALASWAHAARAQTPTPAASGSAPTAAFAPAPPAPSALPASQPVLAPAAPAAALPLPPPPPAPPGSAAPLTAAPPPAYAYPAYPPPPPGYEYAYYEAPQAPKLRFPEDAAVSSTPFIDGILVGVSWEHRFEEALNVGVQAGAYLAGRVRLSAKIAFFTDGYVQDRANSFGPGAKSPSVLYAASAGIVAIRSSNFALSPGILFARTDVSDYGSMLGLSLPFDWVTAAGVRLGFEGGVGRGFGGKNTVSCDFNCPSPRPTEDREAGVAYWLQFQMGFGFHHPSPLPPGEGAR